MKTQDHIDAAFAAALSGSAPKAMYTGATIGTTGWLMDSNTIALFGLILTAIGTAVIVWSKIRDDRRAVREDRRKEREHQVRMAMLAQEAKKGAE